MNKMYNYPQCLKITDNMMFDELNDDKLLEVFEEYFNDRNKFEKTKEYKELTKNVRYKVELDYRLMLAKFRYFKIINNKGYYSEELISDIDRLLEEVMKHIEKFDDDIKILIKETNLIFSIDKTGIIPYIENLEVVIHIQSLRDALYNIDEIDIPSSKDRDKYILKNNLKSQIFFYQSTTMKNIDFNFYKKNKFIRKFLLINNLRRKKDYKMYEKNINDLTSKYYGFKISKWYIILTYIPLFAKSLIKYE